VPGFKSSVQGIIGLYQDMTKSIHAKGYVSLHRDWTESCPVTVKTNIACFNFFNSNSHIAQSVNYC